MSRPLGVAGATAMLQKKLEARVQARAKQLSGIALKLHQEAPRSGSYLNRFGQPRSAPGEQPAKETGALETAIENGVTNTPEGSSVVVNYVVQEFGFDVGARSRLSDRAELRAGGMGARPQGRMAVEELRQEVKNGG